jgi:ABC-2 type transport system permease protein
VAHTAPAPSAAQINVAAPARSPVQVGTFLPMYSLWQRELIRFLRQPSRIVGLLAAPFLFWLLLGSGLGSSFQSEGSANPGYLQYFFPGSIVMVVLFTSIFSNMSTIEDRREGFLMSVLVSPMPRLSLVLGKILGGATQAMIPGMLFVLLAPVAGIPLSVGMIGLAALVLFLIAFSLTGLGLVIAWQMESTQGFHAVLNLLLLPMWMLSGAVFPLTGASAWVQWIMRLNPLAYEVTALRSALLTPQVATDLPFKLTAVFAVLVLIACLLWCGRPSVKNLT